MANEKKEKKNLTKTQLEKVTGGIDNGSSGWDPGYQTVPQSGGNGGYFGKPGEDNYHFVPLDGK